VPWVVGDGNGSLTRYAGKAQREYRIYSALR
jgi:hypothetical protein